MKILKNTPLKTKQKISKQVLSQSIKKQTNILNLSKLIIYKNKFFLLGNSDKSNIIFPKSKSKKKKYSYQKDNIYTYLKKTYNNENLITLDASKKIYKMYLKYFFDFLEKKNINILKGKIFNYSKKKNFKYNLFVGVQGLVINIPKKELIKNSEKIYSFNKWKKLSNYYKLKDTLFLYKNIINKKNKSIKISRKKYLTILSK